MKKSLRTFLLYKGPPWFWGLAIFIGSSIPAEDLPKIIQLTPDKLLHVAAFFVFGILVYRAVSFQKRNSSLYKNFTKTTILISVGYGLFDELHQYFVPGRLPDPLDVLADIVGVVLGLIALRVLRMVPHKRAGQVPIKEQRETK